MPAGILENDNMFSVKERPWHKLGVVLEKAPSISEGIKIAGLDWKVELQNMTTEGGVNVSGKKAVVRTDIKQSLGVVSDAYKVLQNEDAFKFFEAFVESGNATLETAGSLFNGRKVFILAKIAGDNLVVDEATNDVVEKYILLANSHDGSQALSVGFTPIRVVCNNTLTMACETQASQLIRVHHKGDVTSTLTEIQNTMDLINQQFIATEEQYKQLATKDVNKSDIAKYVKQVFSVKSLETIISEYEKEQNEKEAIEAERKRLIARVEEIFELEPVHNAWTLYNSVNSYFNHDSGKSEQTRYNSLWFGCNKRRDRKAFELAFRL